MMRKEMFMLKKKFLAFLFLALTVWLGLPAAAAPAVPGTPPPVEQQMAQPPSAHEAVTNYENAFVKMLVTLLLLIGLIFFTIWMFKRAKSRFGSGGKGEAISILERKPLSQKTILYLIEVDSKQILIAESQHEVRALATLSEETPPPSED